MGHLAVSRALLLGALLAASSAGADTVAQSVGALDRFFPFRLGDSWTYDWQTEGRQHGPRKTTRTRVFEGTEFVGGDLAYKLVSDDGSHHIYSMRQGVLAIHGSVEDGRVLSYQPPVVLAAPDMVVGEPRITDNPDTQRKWKATVLGLEDVTVPLGTFKGCLKVRLEMESPEYVSDSYHDFAPGVGLVAYRFQIGRPGDKVPELKVDARLRLARLSGVPIAKMEDLAGLARAATFDLGGADDPAARSVLKRATDHRYTWDEKFPGFRGDFEYAEEGKPAVRGSFEVDRQLNVSVRTPSEAVQARMRNEISSFISHRKYKPFDAVYAGASFKKGAPRGNGDVEVLAEGDTMGTSYLVRKDEIVSVGRSAGRLRFVANNLSQLRTEDGRYITVEYELLYFSNEDQSQVSSEHTWDSYQKVGGYWLPAGRRHLRQEREQQTAAFTVQLTNLRF